MKNENEKVVTKKNQAQPEEVEINLGKKFLEDNPQYEVKTKIGAITGKPLFMIDGFEMAWCESLDQAGDIARRITNWIKQREIDEKAKSAKGAKKQ